MAKTKKTKKPKNWRAELIPQVTHFGERLGRDALIYSLVGVGSFAALWSGANSLGVVSLAVVLIVGWLANKLVNAYVYKRNALNELEILREQRGINLLKRYSKWADLFKDLDESNQLIGPTKTDREQ